MSLNESSTPSPQPRDAQSIKEEFMRVHGVWSPAWESMLRLDAGFVAAYLQFSRVPQRSSGVHD